MSKKPFNMFHPIKSLHDRADKNTFKGQFVRWILKDAAKSQSQRYSEETKRLKKEKAKSDLDGSYDDGSYDDN